jgi:hypothetical protein
MTTFMSKNHIPAPDGFDKERQALEEEMRYAEHVASEWMKQAHFCPQTFFMCGEEGRFVLKRPRPWTQGHEWFAKAGKLACAATGAYACVFVSEAWTVIPREGRQPDWNQSPSQSPDREEIIMLIGQTREERVQRAIQVFRDDDENFLWLGEPFTFHPDSVKQYGSFLSEQVSTRETKESAKRELEEMGFRRKLTKEESREQGRGTEM